MVAEKDKLLRDAAHAKAGKTKDKEFNSKAANTGAKLWRGKRGRRKEVETRPGREKKQNFYLGNLRDYSGGRENLRIGLLAIGRRGSKEKGGRGGAGG